MHMHTYEMIPNKYCQLEQLPNNKKAKNKKDDDDDDAKKGLQN